MNLLPEGLSQENGHRSRMYGGRIPHHTLRNSAIDSRHGLSPTLRPTWYLVEDMVFDPTPKTSRMGNSSTQKLTTIDTALAHH